MNFSPVVSVAKSTVDPTRIDINFQDKVPEWVSGYLNAIFAREFSRQEIDTAVLQAAQKQADSILENLVGQGLIFRAGVDPEFRSCGE